MPNKKRILFLTRPICPPWDEASKNFAYTLARHTNGFEIHLLTYGKTTDLPKNIVQHGIYSSPKLNLTQKFRLFRFLKKANSFDIVHFLFTPTKLNSFLIKLALGRKKAKLIQSVATLREDLYNTEDFKKMLFGDLIVVYSDYAKEKLEEMGLKNVKRIYPGIDLEKYRPNPKKIILMEKYGIKNNDFVINFTGEYMRLGAIDDVVESFINIAKENENFHLQLACRMKNKADAKKKEEIVKKLKAAECLPKVSFFDDQSYEMADVYNLADISLFPVRDMRGKFDIPLAVIEAMACGKPVIASNLERLRHFLNSENSLLINPGDRQTLQENILYLYKNPDRRRELGEKGLRFVRENFDIIKVAKEYEDVYRNL